MIQATAVALFTLPCVLLAHLLTSGATVTLLAAGLCAVTVFAVAAAVPARTAPRLGLLVAATQVCAHTVLALLPGQGDGATSGCIPAVGRGAELGLQLAVFHRDAGCPNGTLAAGGTTTTAMAAIFTAVAILTGHAVVAALTGLLLTAVQTVVVLLVAMIGLTGLVLVPRRTLPVWRRVLPARATARRLTRPQWRPSPGQRRGPPLVPACSIA